jgi:hypothetical protein
LPQRCIFSCQRGWKRRSIPTLHPTVDCRQRPAASGRQPAAGGQGPAVLVWRGDG